MGKIKNWQPLAYGLIGITVGGCLTLDRRCDWIGALTIVTSIVCCGVHYARKAVRQMGMGDYKGWW